LLQRYWALEQLAEARDPERTYRRLGPDLYGPVNSLNRLFARYNCLSYEGKGYLVAVERDTPEEFTVSAPDLPPETEKAALNAILYWLKPAPYYPPFTTPRERQELQELRRRLARAAQDRLKALDGSEPAVPPEWEGPDWNALPPVVSKLLLYMHRRERADLEEVFPAVWEKEYEAGKGDVQAALHKANNFLVKRQWSRTLHKRRRESEIYWE
jgi:hypothetical protein